MCHIKHVREVCRSCGKDDWLGGNVRNTIILYCADRLASRTRPCRQGPKQEETAFEPGGMCDACIRARRSTQSFPSRRLDVAAVAREQMEWLQCAAGDGDGDLELYEISLNDGSPAAAAVKPYYGGRIRNTWDILNRCFSKLGFMSTGRNGTGSQHLYELENLSS